MVSARGAVPFNKQPAEQGADEGSPPQAGQAEGPLATPDLIDAVRKAQQSKAREGEEVVPMAAHKRRLANLAKKNEGLEKKLADLQQKVAELSQVQRPDEKVLMHQLIEGEKPKGWAEMSPDQQMAWYARAAARQEAEFLDKKQSQRLELTERRLENMDQFRALGAEQRAVVEELRDLHPTLEADPEKLIALAKMEEPGLFRETAASSGSSFVGRPGRGSEDEQRGQGEPTARDIANYLSQLPPDHPQAADAGVWLLKADMEEHYPGVHGPPRGR